MPVGALTGRRPVASLLAFGLAIVGEVASVALVLGSDSDPAGVRWWLVVAPVVVAAIPVAAPRHDVRMGTSVVLAVWVVVASASIGLFFVPAAVAALVAARQTGPSAWSRA